MKSYTVGHLIPPRRGHKIVSFTPWTMVSDFPLKIHIFEVDDPIFCTYSQGIKILLNWIQPRMGVVLYLPT